MAERQEIPVRLDADAGVGTDSWDHAPPTDRMTTGPVGLVAVVPTAVQVPATQATAFSCPVVPTGAATSLQVAPFHCSIRGALALPTATQELGEEQSTPSRKFEEGPGLGLATTDHADPSHCRTTVAVVSRVCPTATQNEAEVQLTEDNLLPLTTGGPVGGWGTIRGWGKER